MFGCGHPHASGLIWHASVDLELCYYPLEGQDGSILAACLYDDGWWSFSYFDVVIINIKKRDSRTWTAVLFNMLVSCCWEDFPPAYRRRQKEPNPDPMNTTNPDRMAVSMMHSDNAGGWIGSSLFGDLDTGRSYR